MSLYDDDDAPGLKETVSSVTGWSKSVSRMIQSQPLKPNSLVSKRTSLPAPLASSNNRNRLSTGFLSSEKQTLAPVINLQKSKKKNSDIDPVPRFAYIGEKIGGEKISLPLNDPNWSVVNEYDPLWPNDYHKVVQEIRESKRGNDDPDSDSKKRRYSEAGRERARERYRRDDGSNVIGGTPGSMMEASGFARRLNDEYSDEEQEDDNRSRSRRRDSRRPHSERHPGSTSSSSSSGAAIAPPPSLTESNGQPPTSSSSSSSSFPPPPSTSEESPKMGSPSMSIARLANSPATGLGFAAKIMAKYGYKHGQGLGKSEQGMAIALSVEKTSKRGGRIIHEKDLMPPPPLFGETSSTPPQVETDQEATEEEQQQQQSEKPSITQLMKNPSKVVLCKNMVGPGEVDDDLEPEVKEECCTKYGDVNKVMIFELHNVVPEEAVRIFIEFKRVESAIKAVVDLNGRFFGGREVTASFYNVDKFENLQLTE